MITAAIGAGIGLGSAIYGGVKSASAAKQQRKELAKQQAKNDAWYERNYYQNYLDGSEAQSAIKRVEDTMRRRNEQTDAQAAITGATPEAQIAQQESNNNLMSNTMGQLAANADRKKQNIDYVNLNNQNNLSGQRMNQYAQSEEGAAQFADNGVGLIGSALQSANWDGTKTTKKS